MRNILLSITLIFSMGAVTEDAAADGMGDLFTSGIVWCENSPGICAAIIGQVAGNYNGWSGGCLVVSGFPTYCILR